MEIVSDSRRHLAALMKEYYIFSNFLAPISMEP